MVKKYGMTQSPTTGLRCHSRVRYHQRNNWLSLSEPHTSESLPQILVLSTMHKKLRQKSDSLRVRREFNGVDYSAFLYGLCNRPCHDK